MRGSAASRARCPSTRLGRGARSALGGRGGAAPAEVLPARAVAGGRCHLAAEAAGSREDTQLGEAGTAHPDRAIRYPSLPL